ncbi:hypothetical protein CL630_00900 [bacterium]|nr:hypothetical protein [bacterium]|tara:strand:- start:326 stop:559 length:234 start_codon:yes stop_codon:yes gene_type:complete
MALAAAIGRKQALAARKRRQEENETRVRFNNDDRCAGSPFHFDCTSCSADIIVPENYTRKPDLCAECDLLKRLGWIE